MEDEAGRARTYELGGLGSYRRHYCDRATCKWLPGLWAKARAMEQTHGILKQYGFSVPLV